ncbi:MAG: hypothetical protein IPL05_00860 [Betaproteobacteria bacterium]|nr:hypothetical protein [Betaproteobacteria bacterium]
MKERAITFLMLVPLLATVMRIAGGPAANISYLLIAGFALLGRKQAIQALALSWLFSMLNPALAPDVSAASIGRYLVIFAAAISVSWRDVVSGAGFAIKRLSLTNAVSRCVDAGSLITV